MKTTTVNLEPVDN